MTMQDIRPANIGWAKLIGGALLYLLITASVAAMLFGDYVFDPKLGINGIAVDPILFVVFAAFVAYEVQKWLSAAYGGRRVIETLVSLTMFMLIAITVAVWMNFPVVGWLLSKGSALIGHPIASKPTSFKLTVVVLFGLLAVWDVFFRDIFGIGRKSDEAAETLRTYRRENLVTGEHGDLPDLTTPLDSRSGAPVFSGATDVVLEPRFWIRDPATGRLVQVKNVPDRLRARTIDHMLTPPAATPTSGAGGQS